MDYKIMTVPPADMATARTQAKGFLRRQPWRFMGVVMIAALPLLSGCTPEKGRQLTTAAAQFRSNAHDAIVSVRGLMDAEIAPPAKTDAQKSDQFSANILSLPDSYRLNSDTMDMAIDPDAVKLSSAEVAARNALMDGLDEQYSAFSAMFDDLERGSLLAAKSIGKTRTYTASLTAQMLGIAKVMAENPPRLTQLRVAVLAQVEKTRKDQTLTPDQKRQALSALMSSWQGVKAQEIALQQDVVTKCSIAAATGQTVLQLADSYRRLSLDDINKLTTGMISVASQLTGKSLTALKTQNVQVQSFLSANPDYKAVADSALVNIQSQLINGAK